MTAVLASRLFSKQGRSSAPLPPSPCELQSQIPSTVQSDARWMNFSHARWELSVPSGVGSSSEARACPSGTVTELRCHEHKDSGTDSWEKGGWKDPPLSKGRPQAPLAVSELYTATVTLQQLRISWRGAGSTCAASGLNNECHSWSSYVHKRETGHRPEITTLRFANYWKEFDIYQLETSTMWEKISSDQTWLPFQLVWSCISTRQETPATAAEHGQRQNMPSRYVLGIRHWGKVLILHKNAPKCQPKCRYP